MPGIKIITKSVLLITCFTSLLVGQKSDLRGVVTDSANGEKIPYATVMVNGVNRGGVTNNNGFYIIAGIPSGRYTVTVTSLGYQTQSKNIIVTGSNPMALNFSLSTKPIEVMEVEVVGGRKSEITEISGSTHLLNQKDIMQVPAVGQSDLFRSIQVLPGIVTTADVSSKFFVRGGSGDQNLIVYDGLKIYNPFHAFGIFSIFDPDIIKSTEVYTGGFPAGFGGRLSSVINIQSDDGNTKSFAGKAGVNLISGKLQLEGPLPGENSWIVNARKSLFNDSFKKFLRNPPPISFYDLFAKVKFGGGEYGKYALNAFTSRDDIHAGSPAEASHTWISTASSLKISDLIQDRAYFESLISVSKFSIERNVAASSLVFPADASVNDISIRMDVTLYSESEDLYFFGFEVSGITTKVHHSASPARAFKVENSAGEFWSWFRYLASFDLFSVDAGIHADVLGVLNGLELTSILQPRINASYSVDPRWKIKASMGVFTQRIMSLTNEDDIISLFEAWIMIPKEEEPQKAVHYSTGIEGNLFTELSVSMQVYLKDYQALTLYNRDKKFASDPDYLMGTGTAFGVETMVRYKMDVMDLYLAYTVGKTTVSVGPYTYPPRYDRTHNFNVLGITQVFDYVDCAVKWEYGSGYAYSQNANVYFRPTFPNLGRESYQPAAGSMYMSIGEKNAARLPSYHRLDFTITYHFAAAIAKGECGISIINLYNSRNILYYDRKTTATIHMLPFLPTAFLSVEF